MARALAMTCLLFGCGEALAAPQTAPEPGVYRLQFQTADKRWDGHTLANSDHRGTLTLTLRGRRATLALEDRWSYHSSSNHGVSGGPIRRLFRELEYRYRWRGRVRKAAGGAVHLTLKLASARCASFPRRGRRKRTPTRCEERPPLALTCAMAVDEVYPPAAGSTVKPAAMAQGEQARSLPTLRCSAKKPLPRLLAFITDARQSIPLVAGAPLQLFAERSSRGKPWVVLRRP